MAVITIRQKGFIKTLAQRIWPYDDAAYRAWLDDSFGVDSCTKLTKAQGIKAIEHLKALSEGRTPKPIKKPKFKGSGQTGYAKHLTQDQANEIERLQKDLGWSDQTLFAFIRRQVGRNVMPSALTLPQATSLITGMRKILRSPRPRT